MYFDWHLSVWGDRIGFGPFVDYQEWNLWHHYFTIGLSFWKWEIGVVVTLWDIEEEIVALETRGMTEKEAWDFVGSVRRKQPDPYHVKHMKKEIEKALAER